MTVPVDFFDVVKEYMHLQSVIQELSSVHSQHQVGKLRQHFNWSLHFFYPSLAGSSMSFIRVLLDNALSMLVM